MVDRIRPMRKPSPHQLQTESLEELEDESRGVTAALRPQNRIEKIYAEDFVHANASTRRMQRAASALIRNNLADALFDFLTRELGCEREEAVVLVEGWCRGDQAAKLEVKAVLATHGFGEHDVEGEAVRRCLSELLIAEQLSASTAARRDKALAGFVFAREITAPLNNEKVTPRATNHRIGRIEPPQRK